MERKYKTYNQPEKQSPLKMIVDSFLTLVVIVLILGFIFTMYKHIYWLAVIIGGAFLLVIDIVMFLKEFEKQRKRNFLLPIITCILGGTMIWCGTMLKNDPVLLMDFVIKYALHFLCFLFLAIGIGILLYALTEPRRKKRYCTAKVYGECVGFGSKCSSSRGGHRVYAPIYKFQFGGETHCVADRPFSKIANPEEGEKRELYFDTETMEEIYEPIRSGQLRIYTYVLGICFVALSIVGFLMIKGGLLLETFIK